MQEHSPDKLLNAEVVVLFLQNFVNTFVKFQFGSKYGKTMDTSGGSQGILIVENTEVLGRLLKYFLEVDSPGCSGGGVSLLILRSQVIQHHLILTQRSLEGILNLVFLAVIEYIVDECLQAYLDAR